MSRRSFIPSLAAWLALFAIAMLFIAPLISKSISHHAAAEHLAVSTVMSGMPAHCQTAPDAGQRKSADKTMSPLEEIACGYCQLLIHLPFVQLMLAVLLWLLLLFVVQSPVPEGTFTPVIRPWALQPARAPPVVFSL